MFSGGHKEEHLLLLIKLTPDQETFKVNKVQTSIPVITFHYSYNE